MSFSTAAFLAGTLIVTVPTSEGLIVAADSLAVDVRSKQSCAYDTKISEIEGVDRTVVALTGLAALVQGGVAFSCGRDLPHLRMFDVRNAFKRFVESEKKNAEAIEIASFAPKLRALFNTLSPDVREALNKQYSGKGIAELIVASYDHKQSISIVRHAWVGIKPGAGIVIIKESVERYSARAAFKVSKFGESQYAERNLSDGTLTKLFTAGDTARLMTSRSRVNAIDKTQASNAASDFIKAVGLRMGTSPSKNPYGIAVTVGGAVDVVFLGKDPRPERLQWKPPPRAPKAPILAVHAVTDIDAINAAVTGGAAAGVSLTNSPAARVVDRQAPPGGSKANAAKKIAAGKIIVLAIRPASEVTQNRAVLVSFPLALARLFRQTMPPNPRQTVKALVVRKAPEPARLAEMAVTQDKPAASSGGQMQDDQAKPSASAAEPALPVTADATPALPD